MSLKRSQFETITDKPNAGFMILLKLKLVILLILYYRSFQFAHYKKVIE